MSGENLTSRLRYLAFKAMMRQEIGWFDEERNSTGALTTRLADDASKVQGATGTRLGTLLETMVSMFVAVVIAFVYSWVLTLVILGVVPVILVASALEVKALSGHTVANKKSLEKAGKVSSLCSWGELYKECAQNSNSSSVPTGLHDGVTSLKRLPPFFNSSGHYMNRSQCCTSSKSLRHALIRVVCTV